MHIPYRDSNGEFRTREVPGSSVNGAWLLWHAVHVGSPVLVTLVPRTIRALLTDRLVLHTLT